VSVQWSEFTPRRGVQPYYRQLAAWVEARIAAGDLQSGDGLPSEAGLADATGLSVDTVRQALAVLRDAGLVETAVGVGSFVA
jgi:DNA-binding GntR family transcriptional regulator